VRKNSEVGLA
jgi:hypothetical protein